MDTLLSGRQLVERPDKFREPFLAFQEFEIASRVCKRHELGFFVEDCDLMESAFDLCSEVFSEPILIFLKSRE